MNPPPVIPQSISSRESDPKSSDPESWSDGIAIIGMSARFPQSRNVQEFWEHLLVGDSLISDLSAEELRRGGVDDATLAESSYVRRGNSIEDADCFDADFFGMSRREAEILDPQQRVFLECAWEALENAGYTADGECVGVFAGAGMNTYVLQLLTNPEVLANAGAYQLMLASDKDYLATRVAYKLNLRGPAVTVQTACSTSLAAVHQACRSLLNRECSMALAGGVSISLPQAVGYSYIPGMILSPDGHCRPFDARAKGTVPGRGAGVVVLKRLSEAVADGDSIVAVIRGSAWNNDGADKVGYTAPSVNGQAEVIRAALAAADIEATRVGYIETHGTATELGDAIECAALAQVFKAKDREQPLILGAVKANMGHADAAAGIAGLIKAALAVNTGVLPPTPGLTQPNPALAMEQTPFAVRASPVQWAGDPERWAGVSSFGIGGTNVHVILSGAPGAPCPKAAEKRPHIFPVSARTASALNTACERLSQRLGTAPSLCATEVATTLQQGRRPFEWRRAVVADSNVEAAALLAKPTKTGESRADLGRDVVFLFPGQGQQFPGMLEDLYRKQDVFRERIDVGCAILQKDAGLDLRPFLTGSERSPALSAAFHETRIAQPALFLTEYALAEWWRSLGVAPVALLGHSLGELSAACVAGVFSFEDGLRLSAERGRLMAQTAPGLMLAVMLPPDKLASFLDSGLWLAAENGPQMSVASGLVHAVEKLERALAAERIATARLGSKNAFHTPLMADAAKAFREVVAATDRHAPKIPWLSNVSGTWIGATEAQDPQYWANQILSPVRFTRDLDALAVRRRLLIEVGPGEALTGIARRQMSTSVMVASLGSENRHTSNKVTFLHAVARAWECGVSIHWDRLDSSASREKIRRVPLPTYPFERQRYWIERASAVAETLTGPGPAASDASAVSPDHFPARRDDISTWFYAPYWQSTPPADIVLPAQNKAVECWLVLGRKDHLSSGLVSALRAHGARVVWVSMGDQFTWQGEEVTVNPSRAVDLDLLWKQMDDSGLQAQALLCLPRFADEMSSSYDAILRILQTAGPRRRYLRRLEFITNALESVSGEPIAESQDSELHGLACVIPAELNGSACRCIDIDLCDEDPGFLIQQLVKELSSDGAGLRVGYRRGMRWQKGWTPAPLKESAELPFRHGGVYLITGGLGGIGYVLAMHLLHQYGARVAITGRTALPDRDKWELRITEHGEDDPTSRRIRQFENLEGAGGTVIFLPADVGDSDAMRGVIETTQQHFGPLNGVIHAAGVSGGSRIVSQSLDEAWAIRRSKVQGSRVLAETLRGSEIDFLLFCSSISAIGPAPTQSAYSAANAFQNNFAEYCRGVLGIPAIAIGFDAWREVGMLTKTVVPEGMESLYDEKMHCAMTNVEGIEVICRALGQWRGPQILISTVALNQWFSLSSRKTTAPLQAEDDRATGLETSELATILQIWKELLGTDSIDPMDNFFSLGGHSLMGTMMIARIRDRLGVTLSLRHVFEVQTPAGLAEIVCSMREKVSSGYLPDTVAADEEREVFDI